MFTIEMRTILIVGYSITIVGSTLSIAAVYLTSIYRGRDEVYWISMTYLAHLLTFSSVLLFSHVVYTVASQIWTVSWFSAIIIHSSLVFGAIAYARGRA